MTGSFTSYRIKIGVTRINALIGLLAEGILKFCNGLWGQGKGWCWKNPVTTNRTVLEGDEVFPLLRSPNTPKS